MVVRSYKKMVDPVMNIFAGNRKKAGRLDLDRPVTDVLREKVSRCVENRSAIQMILPGFPFKSNDASANFYPHVDAGEEAALATLSAMRSHIALVYKQGAALVVSSDGRIFSDALGIPDKDVSIYFQGLSRLAKRDSSIEFVRLSHFLGNDRSDRLRHRFLNRYAEAPDQFRERLEADERLRGLYAHFLKQEKGDATGFELARRSTAYSAMLEEHYPNHIRLSIHPQRDPSRVSINLIGPEDGDKTPWHAVLAETRKGRLLMYKHEAESNGYRLMKKNHRPYKYVED